MNGFFDYAKKERQKLFKTAEKLHFNSLLYQEHFSQSIDYNKQNLQQERENELLKAESYIDDQFLLFQKATLYGELADFYGEQNNLEKSKKYLDLIEQDFKKDVIIDNSIRITYFLAKANYLNNTGEFNEALKYALQKNSIEKNFDSKEDIIDTQYLLAKIYENKGDLANSLKFSKKHNQLKDSLYNVTKANALIFYQTLYEAEKKEKEIVKKNTEISLLEQDNINIKKQLLLGGIGLSAVFGLILMARNKKHLKKGKLLQEQYSQDLLASQEDERQRVSKDLHDSIGQSLLLIKNKIILNNDNETKTMVDNAIEEVRTISRDLHPFQIKDLGLTNAIKKILNQVDEVTDLFVSSKIDSIDGLLQEFEEVHVYRLAQESLNNIIKHSEAQAVRVELTIKKNLIIILIKDNGVGFDFSARYNDFKSLGLKTLKERTKFLKGTMMVDSERHIGTKLEFKIPYKNV